MILIKHVLPKDAEIIITSDWHEGSSMQHSKGINDLIDYVLAKPNRFMIHGGDLVEAIAVDDKRFQMDAAKTGQEMPLAQYQSVINKLRPLAEKKKLLGVHYGNHDERWIKKFGDTVRDIVCKELKVSYGTYSGKYIIRDKTNKIRYKIFVTHGNKSLQMTAKDVIQQIANMKASLKQRLYPLASDCQVMAMGHTHKLLVVEPEHELQLIDDGKSIKQVYAINPGNTTSVHKDHRWYLNTGSMLKLYGEMGVSGYAEKAMYAPTELGYCKIITQDHKIINCEKVVV